MQTHVYTMKTSDDISMMVLITARTPLLAEKILKAEFSKSFGKNYSYEVTKTYAARKLEHLEDYMHHHLDKGREYIYLYNNRDTFHCRFFKVDEAPNLVSISKADHHFPVYVLLDEDIKAL